MLLGLLLCDPVKYLDILWKAHTVAHVSWVQLHIVPTALGE
jgi:hypothetical protein